LEKGLTYVVESSLPVDIQKALRYAVRGQAAKTKTLSYKITTSQAQTKSLHYCLTGVPMSVSKSLTYVVRIYPYKKKVSPYGKKTSPYKKLK